MQSKIKAAGELILLLFWNCKSEMQDFESYAKNFSLQPPLCDEPCEEFQLHGFSACIDCIPY